MLRISIIVLALLGALASGAVGVKWISDANESAAQIETLQAMGMDTSELDQILNGAYMLLGSMVLGFAGAVVAFRRKLVPTSALLILAGVAPALFTAKVLIFTWMLILGGLLALRLKPIEPIAAPA